MKTDLHAFLVESNGIEGITEEPTSDQLKNAEAFIGLDEVIISHLEFLALVFQPDALLRVRKGMDVRVGDYHPPKGGLHVRETLVDILRYGMKFTPRQIHQDYEKLHPFTDCNGRTGRLLWLWQMEKFHGGAPLGFLHTYYYQTLSEGR